MSSKLSLTRRGATTFLLTALLAACGGGGGGDDGPPAGVTGNLTAGAYAAASDSAADTTLGSMDTLLLFVDSASPAAASARATAFGQSRNGVQRLTERRAAAAGAADRRVGTLAVETVVEPCDTGTLTITISYATENVTTPGDFIRIASNNCVFEGEALSGSYTTTVTRYSESSTALSAGFTLAFNNFGSTTESLNGSAAVSLQATPTSEAVSIQYQGLTATFGSASVEWQHTVSFSASSTQAPQAAFSGLIFAGNGFVSLLQVSPFTLDINTGYPTGGILQLTGANDGRVRLVAGSTRFTYQFFAPGNSGATPDASVPGRAYGS